MKNLIALFLTFFSLVTFSQDAKNTLKKNSVADKQKTTTENTQSEIPKKSKTKRNNSATRSLSTLGGISSSFNETNSEKQKNDKLIK